MSAEHVQSDAEKRRQEEDRAMVEAIAKEFSIRPLIVRRVQKLVGDDLTRKTVEWAIVSLERVASVGQKAGKGERDYLEALLKGFACVPYGRQRKLRVLFQANLLVVFPARISSQVFDKMIEAAAVVVADRA